MSRRLLEEALASLVKHGSLGFIEVTDDAACTKCPGDGRCCWPVSRWSKVRQTAHIDCVVDHCRAILDGTYQTQREHAIGMLPGIDIPKVVGYVSTEMPWTHGVSCNMAGCNGRCGICRPVPPVDPNHKPVVKDAPDRRTNLVSTDEGAE